ncbi:hypothetical protein CYFUS_001708 [Cystobacter fuscus]|uniref:Uncharacterized protein n=1 Tax=Cystobacter fuscus TaxID=43 RepID=A0A250IX49_9BACT|nr:hypothetical protein [Cystobacter fuscus]ATB36294.1 hypothetical protein CYFUS_001708 [Cystobacter fuscus]
MGETARQRWHRQQEERQRDGGGQVVAHPELRPTAAQAPLVATARTLTELRRELLVGRLNRLGLPVRLDELPTTDAELKELERLAAESEAAK